MARTLQEILNDLNAAEKEYSEKCKKYGIEEKHRKKKEEAVIDGNGDPVVQEGEPQVQEAVYETNNQEVKEG